MESENRASIKISPEELDKIQKAINVLESALKPLLVTLSAEERREIPKMGDGTEPFVEKVMDYARSNPEFAPGYMNVAELEVDLKAVRNLNSAYRPLVQLVQQLDDSIMLSGSEAYVAALAYYNTVKIGSRMNVPGAKVIYEDLKQRFAKARRKASDNSDQA